MDNCRIGGHSTRVVNLILDEAGAGYLRVLVLFHGKVLR